jgi:hypothetical protein
VTISFSRKTLFHVVGWLVGWFGLAWSGLVWLGVVWFGLVWFGWLVGSKKEEENMDTHLQ